MESELTAEKHSKPFKKTQFWNKLYILQVLVQLWINLTH